MSLHGAPGMGGTGCDPTDQVGLHLTVKRWVRVLNPDVTADEPPLWGLDLILRLAASGVGIIRTIHRVDVRDFNQLLVDGEWR